MIKLNEGNIKELRILEDGEIKKIKELFICGENGEPLKIFNARKSNLRRRSK